MSYGLLVWALCAQVPLPGTSSISEPMEPSFNCEQCHGPSAGFDGSAYETWAGSSMAHTARNPLFLAALSEAEKEDPGIGDFCWRCHAPGAWLEGRAVPTDGTGLDPSDNGIECAFCHRLDPSPWLRNGQFTVGDDLIYRGPYNDAVSDHTVQYSEWISDARSCAACHDVRHPLIKRRNLDGSLTDRDFPMQTTYTEFASSGYDPDVDNCITCHLPEDPGFVGENGPERQDRSSHSFAGGNIFLRAAIALLEPGLGLGTELVTGQVNSWALLRDAATIDLQDAPTTVDRGAEFSFTLRVTNLAGHKLPGGFPEGRRVWLSLEADAIDIDLGRFNETTGEPENPAAIYHVQHGRHGGGSRFGLQDQVLVDTRIPPLEMRVTDATRPVGKVYPEVSASRLANWDDVVINATAPCDTGVTRIELHAKLWYQSVTKEWVDELVAAGGGSSRATRLALAHEEIAPEPYPMVTFDSVISIAPGSECQVDPPDAGFTPDAGTVTPADAGTTKVDPKKEDDGCGCSATTTNRPLLRGLFR